LATIVKANNLCNDYGMDTIAAGTTVAYAFELYDRGLVSSEDLGGLELTWGNGEAVVALTEQLATGEGPGAKLFGDGMKAAAERIGKGSEAFAMHAAGEELPMHDPRCKPGLGASYVIDATPGRHTQWSSWNVEDGFVPAGLNPPPIEDKYVYSGKGKSHYIMSNFGHCVNMAGVCWFATSIGPAEGLPKALSLATGMKFEMADMQEIGARAAALRQAFNFREGFKSLEVKLPDRVLGKPPLGAGPTKDVTVDNEQEIRDYMEVAGWNQSNGCPSEATLRRLGLDFVLDVIGDEARAG
jgi:aldehyde:ferredoxin oxidoreductase